MTPPGRSTGTADPRAAHATSRKTPDAPNGPPGPSRSGQAAFSRGRTTKAKTRELPQVLASVSPSRKPTPAPVRVIGIPLVGGADNTEADAFSRSLAAQEKGMPGLG